MAYARNTLLTVLGIGFLSIGYFDCVNGSWVFGGWQSFTLGLSLFTVAIIPMLDSVTRGRIDRGHRI